MAPIPAHLASRPCRGRRLAAGLALSLVALPLSAPPVAAQVVTEAARPGPVNGTNANSDAFIWGLMTSQIAVPVDRSNPSVAMFETWASDADTFSQSPHWPSPNEAQTFHRSVLAAMRTSAASPSAASQSAIDVACAPPPNPGVGKFPTSGNPQPCIAEEVKRNRAEYDYIVNNRLNTQAGLRSAFARSFDVNMPASAVAVKGDWVPVPTLMQWVPELPSVARVEQLYLTTRVGSTEYALVSLHVSSKRNAAWVWGTFEHRLNPGRCDYTGCFDSFGAQTPSVTSYSGSFNRQYGFCPKTQALQAMMSRAGLSQVWSNYCLKGTQVDYLSEDGTPRALGNSVIEGINANGPIAASSCITCHAYASFGASGTTTPAAGAMLGYNATGRPIMGAIPDSRLFDFTWGVLLAP